MELVGDTLEKTFLKKYTLPNVKKELSLQLKRAKKKLG